MRTRADQFTRLAFVFDVLAIVVEYFYLHSQTFGLEFYGDQSISRSKYEKRSWVGVPPAYTGSEAAPETTESTIG